jgi:UDP-N-acetylmuramate--alanine ligase
MAKAFLEAKNFYLVGIKGVAMTSIAQCLLDAGKNVTGSDVEEDFVTEKVLKNLAIQIENISTIPNFANRKIDAIVYTAAHQGISNPQVQAGIAADVAVYSQAEALGEFFNQKQGIAVCGVGGKSTVSAMLAFVLNKLANQELSFSVGVGEIIGMQRTGLWQANSKYFVAEADEYVIDPHAKDKGQAITPRFSFLKPFATICTNLKYDHPDVYENLEATKIAFAKFFSQIKNGGYLVINGDNPDLVTLAHTLSREDLSIVTFGEKEQCDFRLSDFNFNLLVPGKFNLMNALATLACLTQFGFATEKIIGVLNEFRSTKRRFELVKKDEQHWYFDDYAHHPSELLAIIDTLNEKFGEQKKLIAFQPHTFSRTRELFADFVDALASHTQNTDEILLIDVFPSAREAFDSETNCDKLAAAVKNKYTNCQIKNLKTIADLANYVKTSDYRIFITIGAGDIYHAHELLI